MSLALNFQIRIIIGKDHYRKFSRKYEVSVVYLIFDIRSGHLQKLTSKYSCNTFEPSYFRADPVEYLFELSPQNMDTV